MAVNAINSQNNYWCIKYRAGKSSEEDWAWEKGSQTKSSVTDISGPYAFISWMVSLQWSSLITWGIVWLCVNWDCQLYSLRLRDAKEGGGRGARLSRQVRGRQGQSGRLIVIVWPGIVNRRYGIDSAAHYTTHIYTHPSYSSNGTILIRNLFL